MINKQSIFPLLEDIVRDNNTFKFPIETINKELVYLFLTPVEFDYFIIQCFTKLKSEYGQVIAHIFLQVAELKLGTNFRELPNLELSEYQEKIDDFMSSLENIYITRVDKKSSDGELISIL